MDFLVINKNSFRSSTLFELLDKYDIIYILNKTIYEANFDDDSICFKEDYDENIINIDKVKNNLQLSDKYDLPKKINEDMNFTDIFDIYIDLISINNTGLEYCIKIDDMEKDALYFVYYNDFDMNIKKIDKHNIDDDVFNHPRLFDIIFQTFNGFLPFKQTGFNSAYKIEGYFPDKDEKLPKIKISDDYTKKLYNCILCIKIKNGKWSYCEMQ
jgi:hypothetical protein